MILENVYKAYFEDISTSIVALIIFAVIALVVAFCLFMLYKRTKHIDLKEE